VLDVENYDIKVQGGCLGVAQGNTWTTFGKICFLGWMMGLHPFWMQPSFHVGSKNYP
jgi:hypothetical protein